MEGSEDEDNYSEDSDSSDSWEGGYESDSMYNEDQKKGDAMDSAARKRSLENAATES